MTQITEITEHKVKKQNFGIFYTPQEIVHFIYDILNIWKINDDKINKRWDSKKHYPTVIDPAVGEGVFLKTALETNFTKADFIFGLDTDAEVVKKWPSLCLLDSFKGDKDKLEAHFFHQNGLDKIHWEQHISKYKYKLKSEDINHQQFDAVVGNPPFGGIGVNFQNSTNGSVTLLNALKKFEIFTFRKAFIKAENEKNSSQVNLFGENLPDIKPNFTDDRIAEYAQGMPIEVLFLERFIQLAKPNGWIAIIVPDGILSNANLDYVRKFIAAKTKVEAIISLPRDTFKNTGTNAKTSILFLKKYENELNLLNGINNTLDYPVFISGMDELLSDNFHELVQLYKHFIEKGTLKSPKILDIKKNSCRITIRVDKTLLDLLNVKPNSRFSPDYWDPSFDYLDKILNKYNAKTLLEIEGESCIIAGDHVRPSRGETKGFGLKSGIQYYETAGFLETGYDFSDIKQCSSNAYERLKHTKVKKFDILISNAGVGGVGKGRSCIITHEPSNKSCTGDVFTIRLSKINPFYFFTFLKCDLGRDQILQMKNGVGTDNLNTQETLSIKIPILPDKIQDNIETEFKIINLFHKKAMEYKRKNNNSGYERNINKAEAKLKNLITKTENYIKGKSKKII